jgi:hypothetical protein
MREAAGVDVLVALKELGDCCCFGCCHCDCIGRRRYLGLTRRGEKLRDEGFEVNLNELQKMIEPREVILRDAIEKQLVQRKRATLYTPTSRP